MLPFFNGPPPSKLGFVAKPEMPPHINIMFRARPPLTYVEPEENKHTVKYDFIHDGNHDLDKIFEEGPPPERECKETPAERKEREWREKIIEHYYKVKELRDKYNPQKDVKVDSDPFKTMFVGRLNFDTDEDTLMREMERFGPVKSLHLVRDKKTGKSRGYAFVEFKHTRHCDRLYNSSGMKIDGKRILVDFECGRIMKDWLPKRLGGGKGNKRRDRETEQKIRQIIKDYKRKIRRQSKSKSRRSESKRRSESRRSESKRRESSKIESSREETTHKRQKIDEEKEVERNEPKKQENSKEEKQEIKVPAKQEPPKQETPKQELPKQETPQQEPPKEQPPKEVHQEANVKNGEKQLNETKEPAKVTEDKEMAHKSEISKDNPTPQNGKEDVEKNRSVHAEAPKEKEEQELRKRESHRSE